MKAYVLIAAQMGTIAEIVHDLRRLESVRQAEMTFGPYDVIAEVEADSLPALGTVIRQQIQTIPGVNETMTCVAVHVD